MGYFKNILVHVDGRDDARDLLACAVELARHHQAKLKLVDILPQASWPAKFATGNYDRFLEQLADTKQDRLRQLAFELQTGDLKVTYRLLQAPTSFAIIREAMHGEHDLVIKSTKGHTSRRIGFFGTTSKRLLRKCPLPVLLVKPGVKGPFQRIVAAVDATSDHEEDVQLNGEIMRVAQGLCPAEAELNVLHAWSLYGESILKEHMRLEEFEESLQKTEAHARHCLDNLLIKFGMGVGNKGVHLLQGDPIDVIPAFVAEQHPDLLVMGTVARSGVAGILMGNTAEQVLERVSCSVLAVKPPGFETPIRTAE